ncbi:MAG: hypothetical protein FWD06_09655 [Oscillospiraceae bacterium]|nr:hypothetical protein [Oscillospiraceae bacterium]
MKKLLSIILACALLAVPFAITTMANDTPICPEDEYATVCECEGTYADTDTDTDTDTGEPAPAPGNGSDEDNGNWWRTFVDTVMPYLTDLRNLATRITPIIAMIVAIVNLVRMFT